MNGPVEFVLDVAPFMVWQSNEGGTVTYANQLWTAYTGLSLPLTAEWHSTVHPEDMAMAVQAWKKCCTSKEVSSLAYRIRNIEGGYKWHQVSHHYDSKYHCVWWIGLGTEIPLSNNVNIPVREVEEMYWRIVEATAYPIITVDVEGVVFSFNHAAQEMFMYSPVEILGKPFAEIIDIHGAIADATSTTVQVSAKKRDGTYIPVSLSVGQFQQFGRQLYVLVFHEAEGEIRMQQELHKSKDSFLRNMSHELRTPLFGLLGTMSVMQMPDDPTLQMELKRMEECTWHLLSVVNNMIDFYKLENLYISPVPQPFDPRALIADLCTAHSICVNAGVALSYDIAPEVPCAVVADANFLKHAVSNVLGNAVRFTQEGSVRALVTVDSLDEEGKFMLNFTIEDTGIGISYDFYPKLFQPFMQMDSSDTRQYGGVGLGLAVSKHLINLMGGTITFTSELGKGSEFIVSVPVELPKDDMNSSIGEEVPFANTTPTSSNSGSASISPTSSTSGSPPPSPPHTPTSCSPTARAMRPNSLLSPISFSQMTPTSADRARSPASPATRISTALSPVILHSPPSSLTPGSPIPPAPSPPSLFSDSPFCSPSGSPGGSPPSSPSDRFSNLRIMHSISPIANMQPETSPPAANIFHSFTSCPPFLLDAHGKPLLSHLCPSDRPCPRCAFVRPGHGPQPLVRSVPSAAPYSDPVSPRRTFAAAHRVTSRFVSPAQYASPVIQHSSSSPQFQAPIMRHTRSPSDSSAAAIISQLNLSSSLRPPFSVSSPSLPTRTRLCDSCASIIHEEIVVSAEIARETPKKPDEVAPVRPPCDNLPEPLSSNTTPRTVLDASPRTVPAARTAPIFDDVIVCPPGATPAQDTLTFQETQDLIRALRETQELIPILTPLSPSLSPPPSPSPLSPPLTFAHIDLPTSPTLISTPTLLYTPPPLASSSRQKPRVPALHLSRSASCANVLLPDSPSTDFSSTTSPTGSSSTSTSPFTDSSSTPSPPTTSSSPSSSSSAPSSSRTSPSSPSSTPNLVPRLPLTAQSSTESSPTQNSVLLSPPSFLRRLDELFNTSSSYPSSSSAPTTPTKHTPPTTPSRTRASSISTPKTPKTPRTPRTPRSPARSPHTPPLAGSGPLAILANLFTPQQVSPSKPRAILRSASFSSSPPTPSPSSSPKPTPHAALSTSDNSPSFYAPLIPAQTPSLSTKAAQVLSRVTSLPSLSKSHTHIRPPSPGSSSSGSNSPLSPVLSFVPAGRTASPTFSAIFPAGIASSPSASSLFPGFASSSSSSSPSHPSPPSSPNKTRFFGIVPESPIPVSPRHPLHSSLGTLLIPSPSSSLPTPDPVRKLYVSGPIDIITSPTSSSCSSSPVLSPSSMSPLMSPLTSPTMSPLISPLISPAYSPRLCARENPTEISPPSYSSSPNPFLSTTPIPNSPMSLASSPTFISSSSPSPPSSLSGSPTSLSSSPFASSSPPIISSASPPSPTSTHSPDKTLPSGLRILVVEDNSLNQNIIRKMLERVGWEVILAGNGREALDILFKEGTEKYVGYSAFNTILMDCQMPVLDGYQATRRIRKREKTRLGGTHMKIVAITASSHAEDERKCYEAGMDAFIAKPVTPQTLYSTICQS